MNKFNKSVIFLLIVWLLSSCSNQTSVSENSVSENNVVDSTGTNNSLAEQSISTEASIATGTSTTTTDFVASDTSTTTTISQDKTSTGTDSDSGGKLTISSKCIGCGHCVRFAPKNFSFDNSTHKAVVISQEDLSSDGVQQAIDRCPAQAISIS